MLRRSAAMTRKRGWRLTRIRARIPAGLHDELVAARRRISEVEAELAAAAGASSPGRPESSSARIALAASRRARRLVPPGSRRQQSLHTAASRTQTLVEHGPAALVDRVRRDRELRRAIGVADTPTARRMQYRRVARIAHAVTGGAAGDARWREGDGRCPGDQPSSCRCTTPSESWLEAAIRSVLDQAYPAP